MELDKIEALLEKYFEAETSITEEKELASYFSSSNVVGHLQQYKPLFAYLAVAKEKKVRSKFIVFSKKRKLFWLSAAASVIVLLGIGSYVYLHADTAPEKKELGTYTDPQKALEETQKALAMLSSHVNVGIVGVQYIKEYETTKNRVFVE
jgi:hypothetical protein